MDQPCFNDLSISHDCELLRRIPPLHFIRDPKMQGGITISSAAFDDDEDGPMSVYLNQILQAQGFSRESVLDGHPFFSLMTITAWDARRHCNQGIQPDPEPGAPAHGISCGKKTSGTKRCLRDNARFVVLPMVEVKDALREALGVLRAASEDGGAIDPAVPQRLAQMSLQFGRNQTPAFAEFRSKLLAATGHLENSSAGPSLAALEACLAEATQIAPD